MLDPSEPDRRVDRIIDFVEEQDEPGLAVWAVEAFAGGLGVEALVIYPDDPLGRVHSLVIALADALTIALAELPPDGCDLRGGLVAEVAMSVIAHVGMEAAGGGAPVAELRPSSRP